MFISMKKVIVQLTKHIQAIILEKSKANIILWNTYWMIETSEGEFLNLDENWENNTTEVKIK